MSNGYNEFKKDMDACVKYSKDKSIHAIQYIKGYDNVDAIQYEFCDLLCEDVEEMQNINFIKLEVGAMYDNHDGTWTKDYEYTVYAKEGDWICYNSKTDTMFVVDNEHISEYIEL